MGELIPIRSARGRHLPAGGSCALDHPILRAVGAGRPRGDTAPSTARDPVAVVVTISDAGATAEAESRLEVLIRVGCAPPEGAQTRR